MIVVVNGSEPGRVDRAALSNDVLDCDSTKVNMNFSQIVPQHRLLRPTDGITTHTVLPQLGSSCRITDCTANVGGSISPQNLY